MRVRPWMGLFVFLAACSSSTEPAPKTEPAVTPPVVEPPAVECGDGTYLTAANTCETFPGLNVTRATAAIAPVRDHHASTVIETAAGPYLYVFGGTDDWTVIHTDIQRAKINENGTLDAFEPAGKLKAPRAGHCIVHVKDKLLLVGGIVPANGKSGPSTSSVLVGVGADGQISEVGPGPELPRAVMHLTCDTAGEFVYALGGRGSDSKSTTLSVRAKVNADGTVGAFEAQTALKPDRSHHAAFVREKRLYVLGGITGDPTGDATDRADAIVADIDADGTLGEWSPAGKLPIALSVSSAQLYKDAVYVLGGLEDGVEFSDKIRRATFQPDGTLSPFATLPNKLPEGRGHVHQTPVYKTLIFSIGGKDNAQKSLGTVDIGRFE
jgi:hypothetical protein